MKQITNKEYEEWQKYKEEKAKGHILMPDTLRFICATNDYDPTPRSRQAQTGFRQPVHRGAAKSIGNRWQPCCKDPLSRGDQGCIIRSDHLKEEFSHERD